MTRFPCHILADEQVEATIAIDVDKSCGSTPIALDQARLLTDIGKGAVALIAPQARVPIAGDNDILIAIIVIIRRCHPHAIQRLIETALLRHITKCAIALIAIQAHGRLWLLSLSRPTAAVYEQNVEPSIAVVIEEPSPGTHSFRVPFLPSSPGLVLEDHPGRGRDIGKANRHR